MLVSYNLIKEGYNVKTAVSGEAAIDLSKKEYYDLFILDLMLPNINGLEVCKYLKSQTNTRSVPIMMLTAKSEESDIVKGLEIGADDYLTKPFSPKVFIARVKALLRRFENIEKPKDIVIQAHNLSIDQAKYEVYLNNTPLELTKSEFNVLQLLASHPGRVYTRYQIVEAVKGSDHFVTDRSVDVVIVGIRKVLGDFSYYIETVRGVGYRFKE
jgi:two-component system phosphate regulon response regulator PhoB